jgi:hypothetical protein
MPTTNQSLSVQRLVSLAARVAFAVIAFEIARMLRR